MLIPQVADAIHKEALTQLQKMLTDHLDQVSASHIQAEAAAKAMSEKIITQGTEWAAVKTREAGEAASARVIAEIEKARADAAKQLNRAAVAALFCAVTAACAAIKTIAVLWL